MLMILLPYFDIKGPEGESFQVEIKTDRLTIGRLEQWNDVSCILGQLLEDGSQRYWELTFHDPAITNPAGPADSLTNTAFLEYDWAQARLYRIQHGHRQELGRLRPQEHKLIRYMAQRNRANDGEPVLCTFEELISAVWTEENAPPDADLAHLVWQLRHKIELDYRKPQFLEIVKGLGYRLQLRPSE